MITRHPLHCSIEEAKGGSITMLQRMPYLEGYMNRALRLRQVGGSISATLPKSMAERLHLSAGDTVLAIETERGILLTPYDPKMEEALTLAARASGTYRNALRELAK